MVRIDLTLKANGDHHRGAQGRLHADGRVRGDRCGVCPRRRLDRWRRRGRQRRRGRRSGGTSGAAGSGGVGGDGGQWRGGAAARRLRARGQRAARAAWRGRAGRPGGAGRAALAGTGGAAGRGGTGGVAGTGGAAGRGGTGGAAGTGGGRAGRHRRRAACVPIAEFCYNGADDDCDGKIDCADSDCTPVAQCVPLDAGGARIGVMVAATRDLPAELHRHDRPQPDSLRRPLARDARAARRRSRRAARRFPRSAPRRTARITSNPGTLETTLSSTQACTTPDWVGSTFGTIYGVQAGAFTPTLNGSCAPSGDGDARARRPGRRRAASARPRWSGAAAPPGRPARRLSRRPSKCVMLDGLHTCQAGTTTTYWNTGFNETRTCGACTCGAPTGTELRGDAHPASAPTTPARRTVTATLSSAPAVLLPEQRRLLARARLHRHAHAADLPGQLHRPRAR